MNKRVLLTGALLTAVATIGCSDYVLQPEVEDELRSDASSPVTPPPRPRIDVVRDGNSDTPRGIEDGSGRNITPTTPPKVDIEKDGTLDTPRDGQGRIVPPSPPRIDVIESGKIEIQRP